MITRQHLDNSIEECRELLLKMEQAADCAPEGSLYFKRYPSGKAVPYLSTGPRNHRTVTRIDPADERYLTQLMRKTFARKVLPQLKKDLKALERSKEFRNIEFYRIAAELGPEYKSCADYFLGYPDKKKVNPAFDQLQERQNPFPFDKNAIRTELGVFRSKSESIEAEILTGAGVEFKYEVALLVGTKWINVDFVVNLYWKQQIGIIEHHGLLDDPKYRQKKLDNLSTMMNHGIYPGQNLLIISESLEYGFDVELAKRLIRAFCLPNA